MTRASLPVIAAPEIEPLSVTPSYPRRQRENWSPSGIPAFIYGFRPAFTPGDNDVAGSQAVDGLSRRCIEHGVEARVLTSRGKDLNVDLRQDGASTTKANILTQLILEDARRLSL